MSDIVERLRMYPDRPHWRLTSVLASEAAAEIVKLRGALGEIITGTSGVAEERWEQGVDIAKAALEVTEDE